MVHDQPHLENRPTMDGGTFGVDIARMEEHYLRRDSTARAHWICAALTTSGLTVTAFLPAALLLVPAYSLFQWIELYNNKLASLAYALLFLQTLGAAGVLAFKRWRESFLRIGAAKRLLNLGGFPPAYGAAITYLTSTTCYLVNGMEHTVDSSCAIFYILADGGGGFLTCCQLFILWMLESCVIVSCLVAMLGAFFVLQTLDDTGEDTSFFFAMIIGLVPPFCWYYLFRYVLSRCYDGGNSTRDSYLDVSQSMPAEAEEQEFEMT